MSTINSKMLLNMAKILENFQPPPNPIFIAAPGIDAKLDALIASPRRPAQTMQAFHGMRVIEADIPKQKVFDWSGCRSPARAKRRHARGIPQRVKITEHDVAYMFDARVLTDFAGRFERMAVKAIMGE